jgi:diaminopropionate ammonia-lyase
MRILGNPAGADPRIISGESGASAFGCVASIMSDPDLEDIREELGIDEDSRLLFFSTEGATDTADYRRIVWG